MAPRSNRRTLENAEALESYLRAADPPRWMLRLKEIDAGTRAAREALGAAYADLRERLGHDPAAFAAQWRRTLADWRFDPQVNLRIEQHNDWFPIERQLPLDIRTRDYRLIGGRDYRRPLLDAAWAAREFPPDLG